MTDKLYVAGRLYPLVSIANLWREEGSSWKISWSEIAKDFAATDDSLKKWIILSTGANQDSTHFMMTRSSTEKKAIWVANKGFEISKFEFKFWRARTCELVRARSRLYRSRFLEPNTR